MQRKIKSINNHSDNQDVEIIRQTFKKLFIIIFQNIRANTLEIQEIQKETEAIKNNQMRILDVKSIPK